MSYTEQTVVLARMVPDSQSTSLLLLRPPPQDGTSKPSKRFTRGRRMILTFPSRPNLLVLDTSLTCRRSSGIIIVLPQSSKLSGHNQKKRYCF